MMGHSMMFQAFDPRADYFNQPLHWLKDTGVIDGYFDKYVPLGNKGEVGQSQEEALAMVHILLPLVFAVSALLLSSCRFAWEIATTKSHIELEQEPVCKH